MRQSAVVIYLNFYVNNEKLAFLVIAWKISGNNELGFAQIRGRSWCEFWWPEKSVFSGFAQILDIVYLDLTNQDLRKSGLMSANFDLTNVDVWDMFLFLAFPAPHKEWPDLHRLFDFDWLVWLEAATQTRHDTTTQAAQRNPTSKYIILYIIL